MLEQFEKPLDSEHGPEWRWRGQEGDHQNAAISTDSEWRLFEEGGTGRRGRRQSQCRRWKWIIIIIIIIVIIIIIIIIISSWRYIVIIIGFGEEWTIIWLNKVTNLW